MNVHVNEFAATIGFRKLPLPCPKQPDATSEAGKADECPTSLVLKTSDVSTLSEDVSASLGEDVGRRAGGGVVAEGEFSVNAEGRIKLMGVGQRVVRGAAHIGGVIVAGDSRRVKEVLGPVYEALDLAWKPETAGAIEDVVPGVRPGDVRSALLDRLPTAREWISGKLDPATLLRAESLLDWHDPCRSPRANATAQAGSKTIRVDDSALEA